MPTNMAGGVEGSIKIEPRARGEKMFVVKCQDRTTELVGSCEHDDEHLGSIICVEFLDHLSMKQAHLSWKEVATLLTYPFRTLAVRQTVRTESFPRVFSVLPCCFLCNASNEATTTSVFSQLFSHSTSHRFKKLMHIFVRFRCRH